MSGEVFQFFGLLVQPMASFTGDVFYAEVGPAGSRWLPLPGRTSRWWFEVHALGEPDEYRVDRTTYGYTPGGSGGAFTFRECVRRASAAVDLFVEQADAEWRKLNPVTT